MRLLCCGELLGACIQFVCVYWVLLLCEYLTVVGVCFGSVMYVLLVWVAADCVVVQLGNGCVSWYVFTMCVRFDEEGDRELVGYKYVTV